ncbi:MAG: Unknown protein [uncultured Aureispira sp.]|uniref:Endonuclease GajA/Old nuclease/RecF-like AAA domain-containing protein n=1 Tax=uncultured Aureispira sp. TaxID=1331704 RepID=A0A6S6RRZ0_9BACT|nr:MAG: Unknown protein [uncultured Aureispira sp.]
MKEHDLKISLRNIRAIEQADIILDGITVLAGENGCGKSTISKLAYYIFKTSIEFDAIVEGKLKEYLHEITNTLITLFRDLHFTYNVINENEFSELRKLIVDVNLDRLGILIVVKTINDLVDTLVSYSGREKVKNIPRIKYILRDVLRSEALEDKDTVKELLEKLRKAVLEKRQNTENLKKSRPVTFLHEELELAFYDNPLPPNNYVVKEYGEAIIEPDKKNISPFYSIRNTAYIDSPMMLGVSEFTGRRKHWEYLNSVLSKHGTRINDKNIDKIFKEDILNGEANLSEQTVLLSNMFIYKRKDGKEFNLLECATGIKSFAVLQILFKNGFLTNKTLLIIDEPEAHLHPQWVVEYARLIVLLHKHVGVRFLIASHHPDMVSAIKYISEKEQVDDKLHYYLAEQTGEEFKYNYKELGTDIEAIFESFNIAFERMDLYGNTE